MFAPLYPPARLGGGPIRTLAALLDQQPVGFHSLVFTSDRDLGRKEQLPVRSNVVIKADGRSVYYVSSNRLTKIARGLMTMRRYRPDVLYVNGFFNPFFSGIVQLLAAVGFFRGATLLLAPRGEFSAGALSLKSAKKRWYLRFYRALKLDRKTLWHASSDRERADIRHAFERSLPVVVVREDETNLPDVSRRPPRTTGSALRLVFVARITEMKGLHLLLEALHDVRNSIDASIYGSPEDSEYFARCEHLMKTLPPHVRCRYEGWLEPNDVRDVLAAFDLIANPTSGENFGHVLAESLSVSCPVMCADVTPWTTVIADGGGVVVRSLLRSDWAAELDAYARLSPPDRVARRERAGRAYEQWRSAETPPHVYELVRDVIESSQQS